MQHWLQHSSAICGVHTVILALAARQTGADGIADTTGDADTLEASTELESNELLAADIELSCADTEVEIAALLALLVGGDNELDTPAADEERTMDESMLEEAMTDEDTATLDEAIRCDELMVADSERGVL